MDHSTKKKEPINIGRFSDNGQNIKMDKVLGEKNESLNNINELILESEQLIKECATVSGVEGNTDSASAVMFLDMQSLNTWVTLSITLYFLYESRDYEKFEYFGENDVGFRAFIEQNTSIKYRKAMYMVGLGRMTIEEPKVMQLMDGVGWSLAVEISKAYLSENITFEQIPTLVRAAKVSREEMRKVLASLKGDEKDDAPLFMKFGFSVSEETGKRLGNIISNMLTEGHATTENQAFEKLILEGSNFFNIRAYDE